MYADVYLMLFITPRVIGLDQRLTQDVAMMCHDISHLYGHLLNSGLEAILLFIRLAKLIGILPLFSYCTYFIISHTVLTLSQPLVARLTAYQQELEGQFRSHHARVLTFSQEIAFLKGTTEERDTSHRIFRFVVMFGPPFFGVGGYFFWGLFVVVFVFAIVEQMLTAIYIHFLFLLSH